MTHKMICGGNAATSPEENDNLSLGELRSATCLFETVLFALFDAGIAGKETGLFKGGTAIGLCLKKSAGNAEADCACLTSKTAAVNVDVYVILALCL